MKFLHAADIHLDSPLLNLALWEKEQFDRIRRATRDAFEGLIDLAIEQRVAFLILAGDLYDQDNPNMQIALFLRNQLRRLDKEGIRVVIAKGNHDAANKITSALDLPENTTVLDYKTPQTLVFPEWDVAITGQSFREGPITENLILSYPKATSGLFNIGVLHTSLSGSTEHDVYAPCSLTDLTSRHYQYWALGHIHKGAILSKDPWVVYPGNLQGRHAKETGPKGAVLVEFEGTSVLSADFVALDIVRWQQVPVDLSGTGSEGEMVNTLRTALSGAVRESEGRPVAVRLLLTGETPLLPLLERKPDYIRQTVLELADEISEEGLWIEKIKNETTLPTEKEKGALPEQNDDLLTIMRELADDPTSLLPFLGEELGSLRNKLPEDLKDQVGTFILEKDAPSPDLSLHLSSLLPRLEARLYGSED
ncbi:metallophosphoesterase family protein [Leptospirillum ferriphilum]|uniref:DNA repair exonuclease n=1 Tax=Leptospirillum ferriphilum YSK TaxID=1441628 RepID=A0A059XNI0_9BACT|nr:DNA repair exonuclease [Leptospirillum ferriphilum]AIA30094.1 DNA repair exonuclease [Leptospirillum ferriphilum YSK]